LSGLVDDADPPPTQNHRIVSEDDQQMTAKPVCVKSLILCVCVCVCVCVCFAGLSEDDLQIEFEYHKSLIA